MTECDIGIVVPTLGTREEFLKATLQSIRRAGEVHICVVAPKTVDLADLTAQGLIDSRIDDPNKGLAAAINEGIRSLPESIVYTSWIGDDDLYHENAIEKVATLMSEGAYDFVWGQCRYINAEQDEIWLNKSGMWARYLIRFGPNLVPQPGSMFSRRAFNEIGGLDTKYGWAFDQDFFTKLFRNYQTKFFPEILASFRWHAGSLSAGSREGSVRESSLIRIKNLPSVIRPFAQLWEFPMRHLITLAGKSMNKRVMK